MAYFVIWTAFFIFFKLLNLEFLEVIFGVDD